MPPSNSERLTSTAFRRNTDNLLFVFGDQLDPHLPSRIRLDKQSDSVLMVEAREEAEHVPSHRQRTTLFLAAMRSYALDLLDKGYTVRYVKLDDPSNTDSLGSELERAISDLQPSRVSIVQPGEHRVETMITAACERHEVTLEIFPDESFTCSQEEFAAWAEGRSRLTMEYFYRERRKRHRILLPGGKPAGGVWNYDSENRAAFSETPEVPKPYRPRLDAETQEVMDLVGRTFPEAPGRMDHFRWPVTPTQAKRALDRFIQDRLPHFGTYEDAMWAGETFLYHSALSAPLNLKLLDPMQCIEAAVSAYESGSATLNNVEGFVRQILGWREFIRGVYFHEGPDYPNRNGLDQKGSLPDFFWNGETEMNCLRHGLEDVLDHGYSHHIPRLMVIGNFTLLASVDPSAVHAWFLAMYVDALEWVTAPNVIGMSQHADGGVVATKPYAASGKYINRMSNFCRACPYDVGKRTGDTACPYNVLYWDFLLGHRRTFKTNQRMSMMFRNVDRLSSGERKYIRSSARRLRKKWGVGSP